MDRRVPSLIVVILFALALAGGWACSSSEHESASSDADAGDDVSDDDASDDAGDDDAAAPRDDGSFVDDATPFVSGLDARTADYLEKCAR